MYYIYRVYILYLQKQKASYQAHVKGKLIERWNNIAHKLRSVRAISYERKRNIATPAKTSLLLESSGEFNNS